MSFYNQNIPRPQQPYNPYPPPGFGSQNWVTNPFSLTPPNNGVPFDNGVGTGQQSSYQEATYTLPGAGTMSYHEWSG